MLNYVVKLSYFHVHDLMTKFVYITESGADNWVIEFMDKEQIQIQVIIHI